MALSNKVHKSLLLLSMLCYGVALCFPGLAPYEPNPQGFTGVAGYVCLAFGWSTIVTGTKYFLPWLANLFYFPALLVWGVTTKPPRWGAVMAGVGLALTALTFRIDTVMVNEAGQRVGVRPGLGAWLWMASFAVLLVGFLLQGRLNLKTGMVDRG